MSAAGKEGEEYAVERSDEQWRESLSPDAYRVLRHHGTERPGTSPLNVEKRDGVFHCAGCQAPLFTSDTKYESGSGWPSFWKPIEGAVKTTTDQSHGMIRTELKCATCGGHLGHVFPDGPRPTGLRYCMNGVALDFHPKDEDGLALE
jgi:peptide-methionine (R)-S-oxide reductase